MTSICIMREIYRALDTFSLEFSRVHGVCLNEATAMCALAPGPAMATGVASDTGMTASHTSKVLRSLERKGLILRTLGEKDRRQMVFSLTPRGKRRLSSMQCGSVAIPEILKPIFEKHCHG